MALCGHTRAAAWVAAGILFLTGGAAACGDGHEGKGRPSPTAPTATRTPRPTATPKGDRPADPAAAERQIRKNWEKFFDLSVPADQKVNLVENGELLRPVLKAISGDPRTRDVRGKVEKVTFTSATRARVRYALTMRGETVLPDTSGVAVLRDGVWKVSAGSLCALVPKNGDRPRIPGC